VEGKRRGESLSCSEDGVVVMLWVEDDVPGSGADSSGGPHPLTVPSLLLFLCVVFSFSRDLSTLRMQHRVRRNTET